MIKIKKKVSGKYQMIISLVAGVISILTAIEVSSLAAIEVSSIGILWYTIPQAVD